MTILVGILCENGIVIGADTSATFGRISRSTIEQPCKKITIINNYVIIAGTGFMGLGQRFVEVIRKQYENKLFQISSPIEIARILSREAIKDFQETNTPKGLFGALVAFHCGGRACLVEFDIDNFQPSVMDTNIWYASMGSGQPIADPFLGLMRRVFCPKSPPQLATGIFITAWTLEHTIDVNPGGIKGPFHLAILKRDVAAKGKFVAKELDEAELDEHYNNVEAAYKHLGEYAYIISGKDAPELPKTPVSSII